MECSIEKLDRSLLICPEDHKRKILDILYRQRQIVDVKFMTLNEFRKKKFFDYDIRAIRYLKDHFGLSIANAKEILANLYYVDTEEVYHDEKLDALVSYRKKLDENGLLIYDPLFLSSLQGRSVYIAGYGKLKKEDLAMIGGELIPVEEKEKHYEIASYEDIEDELTGLYEKIQTLIYEEGVDINRIFVLNGNDDYLSGFRRFNRCYPFDIEVRNDDVIAGTAMGKKFLEMIGTSSKEEIYEWLTKEDSDLSASLISILNRYPQYTPEEMKDFISEDLKQTKIDHTVYKDIVRCADLHQSFDEDDHVFLIGFSDSFPSFESDSDYLSDPLRRRLGLSDTKERNALIRFNTRAYLSAIDHLYVSRCRKSPFRSYELSNLWETGEYELKEVHPSSGSFAFSRTKLAGMLDRLHRFGTHDEGLDRLYNTFPEIGYREYDNRFDGLNREQIEGISKVVLSYSSMDRFYKCSFAYYLEKILKVSTFDDNFNTKIGTLFHNVLRDLYEEKDFDPDLSFEKNLQEMKEGFESEAERFLITLLKEELKKDIEIILEQKGKTHLDDQLCEKEFFVWADRNIGFKGFIDKVMYHEKEDEVIADVVDYKTGNSSDINEKLMEFGLSMQLPSYMYLLKNSDLFDKKIGFGGFYLQHIVNTDLSFDENRDREQIKRDSMKLEGFTTSDMDRLSWCDDTIAEGSSEIIRGLRLTKGGSFYATCKVLSDEEIGKKIKLAEDKIRKAGKAILEGKFGIDPKEIDGENRSCSYCPYRAICYRRNSDIVRLSTEEKEEGHGGKVDGSPA